MVTEKWSPELYGRYERLYEWGGTNNVSATLSGFGAQIARQDKVKLGGKTKVDVSPDTQDAKNMTDEKFTSKVDFPKAPYAPSNPATRNLHLTKMWTDNIAAMTNRAKKLQRSGTK